MMRWLLVGLMAIGSLLALPFWYLSTCKPGGLTCMPNRAAVQEMLKSRYADIEVTDLTFSISPFGSPSDDTQRFRVEFSGNAVLLMDYFNQLDQYRDFCDLPEAFVFPNDMPFVYTRVAKKGDKILFSGDTAMYGEAGKWTNSANLMNYKTSSGESLYGRSRASILQGNKNQTLLVIGEPAAIAYCDALKKNVAENK
jgi:hypothetical protein